MNQVVLGFGMTKSANQEGSRDSTNSLTMKDDVGENDHKQQELQLLQINSSDITSSADSSPFSADNRRRSSLDDKSGRHFRHSDAGRVLAENQYKRQHSPPNTDSSDRIRFLSFNIFIRYPLPWPFFMPCGAKRHNDFKRERLTKFTDLYLDQYDVVCLQEMHGTFGFNRQFMKKRAVAKGYHVIYSPQPSWIKCHGATKGKIVDGGLMTISKYPIIEHDFVHYAAGNGVDTLASKGVLYTLLDIAPGKRLHVFNTHLQATYGDKGYDKDKQTRADQAMELVAFMEKKVRQAPAKYPVMLGGDFNIDARPTQEQLDDNPSEKDSREYQDFKDILRSVPPFDNMFDVLFNAHHEHLTTIFNTALPFNLLCHDKDYYDIENNGALDHQFFFANGTDWLSYETLTAKVQPFEVQPDDDYPGHFLSDHHGIESCLKISPFDPITSESDVDVVLSGLSPKAIGKPSKTKSNKQFQ